MESSFINKTTLANLNNELVKQINLQDKSREEKKQILSSLLGNMKKVYNRLDKTKINEKNFNKIFDTFSKYSIINTIDEIKPKNENAFKAVNTNQMSYNRDKDVAPTTTVQYLERPESTFSVKENFFDVNNRNMSTNVNLNNNLTNFDNPQSSRYNSNIPPEKAMESMLSERRMLTPDVQRPPTPDFLKETKVGRSKNNEYKNESFSSGSINNNFKDDSNRMSGDTYYLSGANQDSNFGSINFQNNELTSGLPEVDESIDTNKRLEMLQQERSNDFNSSNISTNDNMIKPDFTKSISENEQMLKKYNENKKIESNIQNSQMQFYQNNNSFQQQNMQSPSFYQNNNRSENSNLENASNSNTGNIIDKLNMMESTDLMNLLNSYAKQNSSNNRQIEPNIKKESNFKNQTLNSSKSYDTGNEHINEYLNDLSQKQVEQMRQVQMLQEQLQEALKNQMLNANHQNQNYEENDALKSELISKVKILTGQLEQEKKVNIELRSRMDEIMNEKEDENDRKLALIEEKKQEIRSEVTNISIKNNELDASYKNLLIKENFIKGLIEKNLLLLKADKHTVFIDSKNYGNKTEFRYELVKELKNVKKLEILSYDIPLNNNNINEGNNKLHFKFSDENVSQTKEKSNESDSEQEVYESEDTDSLVVPTGNYDISTLVKKLNKIGKSYNLTFSYNKNTSKVTIKSEKKFSILKKEDSIMNILGFSLDSYSDEDTYVGNKSYDIRKCNYAHLFISNIKESEIAVVNISGSKNSYYYVDLDDLDIKYLDLSLKDDDENLLDFCNLPFKLEMNFIYSNDEIQIDDKYDSMDEIVGNSSNNLESIEN